MAWEKLHQDSNEQQNAWESPIRQETNRQNEIARSWLALAQSRWIDVNPAANQLEWVRLQAAWNFLDTIWTSVSKRRELMWEVQASPVIKESNNVWELIWENTNNKFSEISEWVKHLIIWKNIQWNTNEEIIKNVVNNKELVVLIYEFIEQYKLDWVSWCPYLEINGIPIIFEKLIIWVKNEYLDIKKGNLKEKLLQLKNKNWEQITEEVIERILNSQKCNPLNLKQTILDLWFDEKVVKDIFEPMVDIKELQAQVNLWNLWIHEEEIKEFLELPENDRREKLKEKFSDEEIEEIIWALNTLKQTEKYKNIWFDVVIQSVLIAENKEDLEKLLERDLNMSEIIKELKNNESVYVKLISDKLIIMEVSSIDDIIQNYQSIIPVLEKEDNSWWLTEHWKKLLILLKKYETEKKFKLTKNYEKVEETRQREALQNWDIQKPEKTTEKISNNNIDKHTYNQDFWTIEIPWTKEIIQLSREEQVLAKKPETLENIVNFYRFFKKLNLEWVWKYRKELTLAMWDVNININDDSLKKSELTRFANKLIAFLNNSLNTNLNENNIWLSAIESELRKVTWAWAYFDWQTFNIQWEDIITANLRNLWIIGWACFHTIQFREILNWKKVDNKEKNI